MKINYKNKKQKGLTLIELALVIAGLAIISFGAIVVSGGVLDNARISSMTNQIESTKTAIELSKLHTGCTPTSLAILIENKQKHTSCGTGSAALTKWDGPYIQNAEIDVSTGVMKLSNITDGTKMQLFSDGGTPADDVFLQTDTDSTEIGTGVIDNLCPGASAVITKANLSATTTCGYTATDKKQGLFLVQ